MTTRDTGAPSQPGLKQRCQLNLMSTQTKVPMQGQAVQDMEWQMSQDEACAASFKVGYLIPRRALIALSNHLYC